MKKIVLVLFGVLFLTVANAQIRWGVKAGGNLSKITDKLDGDKIDGAKARLGFHLGGMMEYSFNPSFALQPELLFSVNGGKTEFEGILDIPGMGDVDFKGDEISTIYQIQIPVNLKYVMGTDDMKFFVTAGPYFGIGLSAKGKLKGLANYKDLTSIGIEQTGVNLCDNRVKRFDFGIGARIGIEIKKIMIGAGYQFGITNLSDIDKTSSRLGTFQLSVGYFF